MKWISTFQRHPVTCVTNNTSKENKTKNARIVWPPYVHRNKSLQSISDVQHSLLGWNAVWLCTPVPNEMFVLWTANERYITLLPPPGSPSPRHCLDIVNIWSRNTCILIRAHTTQLWQLLKQKHNVLKQCTNHQHHGRPRLQGEILYEYNTRDTQTGRQAERQTSAGEKCKVFATPITPQSTPRVLRTVKASSVIADHSHSHIFLFSAG